MQLANTVREVRKRISGNRFRNSELQNPKTGSPWDTESKLFAEWTFTPRASISE